MGMNLTVQGVNVTGMGKVAERLTVFTVAVLVGLLTGLTGTQPAGMSMARK